MSRRLAAAASLLLLAAASVLALVAAVESFPRGITVLACIAVAITAAWWGVVRGGAALAAGLASAVLLIVGAVVLVAVEGRLWENLLIVAAFALAVAAARAAFAPHVKLASAPRPERPVLF